MSIGAHSLKGRHKLSERTRSSRRASAKSVLSLSLACLFGCPQAWALREGGGGPIPLIRSSHFGQDVCSVIGAEASRRKLPESFFARLIWKESLFNPDALSAKGAEGIAQFMPETAAERGLEDAFDPAEAIAASASYLADLRDQFRSLGLATAAYNAGPTRVKNWLSGAGTLPLETQKYVHFITGFTADAWVEKKGQLYPLPISGDAPFSATCPKLAARQLRAKSPDTPFELSNQVELSSPAGRKASSAIASPKKSAKASSPNTPVKKKAAKKATPMSWGVQIAAHFSQKVALIQFSRTKAKYPSILKGSAITVTSRNPRKGLKALQTVRVGAPSRAAAETICNKLRSAGGACLVVKN